MQMALLIILVVLVLMTLSTQIYIMVFLKRKLKHKGANDSLLN